MNKNRLYIGLLVAVMLAVLVYVSYGKLLFCGSDRR